MFDRMPGAWRLLTRCCLVAMASISVASAQSQPNPPTGLSIDDGAPGSGNPPPDGLPFFDDFNYVVNKNDSGDRKTAVFTARGYTGVKDETTRPGASGYLYTRTSAPGCGAPPAWVVPG